MNWAYLVKCSDDTLYAGWTNDLTKRMKAHSSGKGAKYTSGRAPVRLVWATAYPSRGEAMACEAQLKKLSRKQKQVLIAQFTKQMQGPPAKENA